ncbi:uncharacterized protein LOC106158721 [Lingula anatina]|uniref:Uncharacterized protein LOC106158721 n=1 Tax=Lingula anatina TaxID=7574 RepID=A0A1S3HXG9_LINAN|nr:uncharacterized protein LOC106158721 [Lingula anatina]|eukprot:XP_013390256.1 uncharacterized protein LOC106158721 [Lingula anatina]
MAVNHLVLVLLTILFQEIAPVYSNGRVLELPAIDYVDKYKRHLALGECPTRTINGREVSCPVKTPYRGTPKYYEYPVTRITYKQANSVEDIFREMTVMGGVGVSFMGLIGASVSARYTETLNAKSNSITMMGHVTAQRGFWTLGHPRPSSNIGSLSRYQTKYYVSDILVGGEDSLIVQLNFNSEEVKKKVEITIKIKLLFFTITTKMEWVKTNFKGSASVDIRRISSIGNSVKESYCCDLAGYDRALARVRQLEAEMAKVGTDLKKISVSDERLHTGYLLTPFDTESTDLKYMNVVFTHRMKRLTDQKNEVETVLNQVQRELQKVQPSSRLGALNSLELELTRIRTQMTNALNRFTQLTLSQTTSLGSYYGNLRAPFYYTRKLAQILAS